MSPFETFPDPAAARAAERSVLHLNELVQSAAEETHRDDRRE